MSTVKSSSNLTIKMHTQEFLKLVYMLQFITEKTEVITE